MADIRAVLFDLDGTLLDTAPDLADALNRVLERHRRAALPLETIRPAVSHGATALVHLGFGLWRGDPGFDERRREVLECYAERICEHTRVFPGMPEVLDELEGRGILWGVVTNKPARFTEPLMAALDLTRRAACVVSGDTTANSKPHPEPLLYACELTGAAPAACLYLGDASRDIQAGHNAGMLTLAAAFGYLSEHDRPESWGAHGVIHRPAELLDWL
jgi:phosphoglycolate phosphatase